MTLSPSLVIFVTAGYILLIFLAGYHARRRMLEGRSITDSPIVYSLSITVYATTWTFYGSIGKAATTGLDFILIYLGPSLIAFSWWFFLRKIVRISKENNITSIADFLSSRYGKSQPLGALITVIALLGIMPYIALQLKAISRSFGIITGMENGTLSHLADMVPFIHPGFVAALVLALLSIVFGARRLVSSERHEGLMAALAIESIVKLASFLIVGGYITFAMFDGMGEIFSRMHREFPLAYRQMTTFSNGLNPVSYPTVFTMLLLSTCAVMLLPRQFHAMVIENSTEEQIRQAMWRFPLYLFMINIFVLPVAMAGILLTGSREGADFFLLTIPLKSNHPWLSLVVFIGGFSAAAGMVMVESIAISTMFLNHILMPIVVRLKPRNWFPLLLINLKRLGIVVVILLGYFYQYTVGDTVMLVNMGLISFSAAAQFAPAMVGGLYWKRGNSYGAIGGITAGFIIWFYTLLVPSIEQSGFLPTRLIDDGLLGLPFLKPYALFGISGLDVWSHSLFWSLFFNIAVYVACSILIPTREEEIEQARKFVDVFAPPETTRRWERKRLSKPVTIMQLVTLMSKFIGKEQAHAAIAEYIGDREIDEKGSVSEFELPNLKRFVEKTLAASVGAAAAGAIVESYLSGIGSRMESFYDIFSNVRTSLAESREALYVRLRASEIINRSLDIQIIMDDLLDLLQHELKFDALAIRLANQDGTLEIKAKRGIDDDSAFKPQINPIISTYIGDAFLSNRVVFINDTSNILKQPSRMIVEQEGIRAFAHIPLSQTGEVPIGILSVFSRSMTGIFTEPLVQLLTSLAGQLTQAIRIVREKEAREKERMEKEQALLENARVTRDMELARQIQRSLLPTTIPEPLRGHIAATCIPATHVGGDYYDFTMPTPHDITLFIADVSGHNVAAALIMVETRGFFRIFSSSRKGTADTLSLMNRQLFHDLSVSELFITAFYAKYDSRRGILTYSNAGHNRPLVVRHDGDEVIELDTEGLILGIREKVEFEQKEMELSEGDLVILYTDGITEAENEEGIQFGVERLRDLVRSSVHDEPGRIIERVIAEVYRHAGEKTVEDDISLVVLRIPSGQSNQKEQTKP
ncbi:MAG: SpoIIE family protein phosphatase [Desulfuromonadia bacterium]